ncbi:TonB-linked SusC/RagA family outer membrane protein [Pedobacter africanus]|uniref:TonB-linked SusC/RagA family outer membrane protein n=1 Tax=Pedobacter africanus TaxID=151894 RepID=A0ACC6KSK4_9SPHI|nr:SusC/RagA family TonB-linked outer membrane protein [Pedobacter africanus]MDR6782186.1 TonB-linked SusC/RagA family outer membrane protein [Pedobacter africanus]
MKFYIQLKRKLLLCTSTKGILSKQTVMRINLTCILLLMTLMQVSASGFAQRLTLSRKNITLEQLFREIKAQSGYDFLYEPQELRSAKRISINVNGAQLRNVLDEAFNHQPLTYTIDQNTIVVRRKEKSLFESISDFFKKINISGKVTDQKGNPLPGATVKVKGSSKAVITNAQGNFRLNDVEEGVVLVVSYIGYKPKEIAGRAGFMNIVLDESSAELAAVAITGSTGYQKISKDRATGSYDVVGQEVLSRRPVSNLSTALQGTVAGLQAKENLDGSVSFLLRGAGTMNSTTNQPLAVTQPLVVVDGFAISGFDFNNINPNDVESVTVLKDAAALSIWGSRGANGVIVITTKTPKAGKSNVEVQAFTRISDMIDLDQVMRQAKSPDHIRYEKLAFDRNLVLFPYAGGFTEIQKPLTLAQEQLFAFRNGTITESQLNSELARLSAIDNRSQIREELMQRAILNQVNLRFSGGTEKMRTAASLLYENNREGFKKRGYDRVVLNFNNNFKATSFLTFNFGANVSYRKNDFSGVGGQSGTDIAEIEELSPYELLLNEDGSYGVNLRRLNRVELSKLPLNKFPYQDWSYNLLREVRGRERTNENISVRLQGGVTAKILSGLNFDGTAQYEKRKINSRSYFNEETFEVRNYVNSYLEYNDATKAVGKIYLPKGGILRTSQGIYDGSNLREGDFQSYTLRGQFNFDKKIGNKHQITAIAGSEIVDELTTGQNNPTAWGYFPEKNQITVPPYGYGSSVNPLRTFDNPVAAAPLPPLGSLFPTDGGNTILSWRSNRLASFYTSAGYTFDGKYSLSGSVRSDASNFITDNPKLRWTPLWSVGAMWNAGNENFIKPLKWIDALNVRLTYGSNGLANQTVSTQTLVNIGTSPNASTGLISGTIGTVGNELLRWERTYTTNFGIDFSLFGRKLFGKFDAYNKIGKDIVGNIALASATGTTSARVNNAGISNKGIEIELGTLVTISRDFAYNTNLTYAYNKNKVTKLYFPALVAFEMIDGQYVEERPVGAVYAYNYAGMIDGVPYVEGPNQTPSTMNAVTLHNRGLGREFLRYEGTAIPPHTLGWINNFSYRNFNLMVVMTGTFGGKFRRPVFNYSTTVGSSKTSVDRFVADVFAGDPTMPEFPKLNESNSYLWSRYTPNLHGLVESSSFMELKEVNLEYFLPKSWANKASFSNIKVYAQMRNMGLLYTNNSKNYHPEWLPGTNRPVGTYTFGLNLQF